MISITIGKANYNINQFSDYIEAICLFGSKARGDNDFLSDTDVFILIKDCTEETYVQIKKSFESQLGLPAHWISMYRMSTITSMHKKGSYFLWHLKMEGEILYSKDKILYELFRTLPSYTNVEKDLYDYLTICGDIKESIALDLTTAHYDLSVIASLVRNTCISISYLNDHLIFGRNEPIMYVKKLVGDNFPFSFNEYRELYKFRIAYTRNNEDLELPEITEEYIKKWIKNVEFLIQFGIKYIKEGE